MTEERPKIINVDDITYKEVSDSKVMAKSPLVSVKMLTYNHELYIAQAIEGVLMQECNFDIELIIGEDCSTDRTREIVMKYQKMRPDIIRVVAWDKNTGGRRNSQVVNGLMRGRYVAFNEGDDYWTHPKKLQMQVDIMKKDPDVGLVHGGADVYDTVIGSLTPYRPRIIEWFNDDEMFERILTDRYPHIHTPTVCMRTCLFLGVKADNPDSFSSEFLMGDTQMWLESSRLSKIVMIQESLATYNILAESACNTQDKRKKLQFSINAYKMRMHFIAKYKCAEDVGITIHQKNRTIGKLAFSIGDYEIAKNAFITLKQINRRLTVIDKLYEYGSENSVITPIVKAILITLPNIHQNIRDNIKKVLPDIILRQLRTARAMLTVGAIFK